MLAGNPELMKAMQTMMQDMTPEDLVTMSQQAGMSLSQDQVNLKFMLHVLVLPGVKDLHHIF